MVSVRLFLLEALYGVAVKPKKEYSASHHDGNHLLGGRGDARYNEHMDQNRLVGSAHQGDPQGKGVPRACAKSKYTEDVSEGGREIFQCVKESFDAS